MKKNFAPTALFTLLLACLIAFSVNAQQKTPSLKALYFNLPFKLGKTDYRYQAYGIQSAWKNGLLIGIDRERYKNTPDNIPSDYDPGTATFLGFPLNIALPEATTRYTTITAGYRKPLSRNTWFTIEAGPSMVKKDRFSFKKAVPATNNTTGSWGDAFLQLFGISGTPGNYDIEKTTQNQFGGAWRSSLQWAFTNYTALQLGVHGNFTRNETRFGVYFSFAVGLQGAGPRKLRKPL